MLSSLSPRTGGSVPPFHILSSFSCRDGPPSVLNDTCIYRFESDQARRAW